MLPKICESGAKVTVSTVSRVLTTEYLDSTSIMASLISRRANRIPMHARGPWPKLRNAYLKGNYFVTFSVKNYNRTGTQSFPRLSAHFTNAV